MTSDIPVREVEPASWRAVHEELREQGYTFFDFVTAVDESDRDEDAGFDVVSHLYDITDGARRSILVRTRVRTTREDTEWPHVDSLTPIFRGAAWHERETHEMFGIVFDGFDDGTGQGLRKLLLPESFTGKPLLKSFVLTARVSKAWPGAKEPGEREGGGPKRRKMMPPGVPDDTWGPR